MDELLNRRPADGKNRNRWVLVEGVQASVSDLGGSYSGGNGSVVVEPVTRGKVDRRVWEDGLGGVFCG